MRIQNLKAVSEPAAAAAGPTPPAADAGPGETPLAPGGDPAALAERQALEIALLQARLQHMELVVETARSLMGSNQERLLRRLHEAPREIAALSGQLRRIDPQGAW